MIDKTNSIISMLMNVEEKAKIIRNDFERNGKVHYNYILEKLESAKCDLDNLVEIAKEGGK
jgi:hypothetical protein